MKNKSLETIAYKESILWCKLYGIFLIYFFIVGILMLGFCVYTIFEGSPHRISEGAPTSSPDWMAWFGTGAWWILTFFACWKWPKKPIPLDAEGSSNG